MCKAGICTQCDIPIETDGIALPCYKKIVLVLISGSTIMISVCNDCLSNLDLKHIWNEELNAWKEEISDDRRLKNKSIPYTKKQKKILSKNLLRLVYDVPIGLYAVIK